MLLVVDQDNRNREHIALRSMFAARKRVFVDLLKWDLPVLADRYEIDQFDDPHANYLIVTDTEGEHLASARLLPTTRPALLDSLFPHLVTGPVPRGEDVVEITRFCLSREANASTRRIARDKLLIGLVQHAQANGVRIYTGVADVAWFRQIQGFGWECTELGAPCLEGGRSLTALRIAIDATTLGRLAAAGIGAAARAHARAA